jgi:ribonuclease III
MAVCDPLQPAVPGRELTSPKSLVPAPLTELAAALGHDFALPALLREAVTHPSAPGSARGGRGYQRLEWLGDRVFGLAIADLLWRRFPAEPEGHLTRRYANLVRQEALARVGEMLNLGRYLILSPSDALAGLASKPAVLADVCEAVIGAIYVDGGFEAAIGIIQRLWEPLIEEMPAPPRSSKTQLQEWAQARGLGLPDYLVVETSGPAHALRFTVKARVGSYEAAAATGSSKQQAQEEAASLLLAALADKMHEPRKRRKK